MQYEHDELLSRSQEYIDLMKKNGLGYFRLKNDKFEIELGDKPARPAFPLMPPMNAASFPPPPAGAVQPSQSAPPAKPCPAETKPGNIVRSPIIGTFYAAPSPEKPPYAPVGKQIKKGAVLFIIESMKLMNEVTSEFEGTVAEVFVKDGETVEYDQPIMRIE